VRKTVVVFSMFAVLTACATKPSEPGGQKSAVAAKEVCKVIEDDSTGTKITTRRVCERVPIDTPADEPGT
jgi:hypothetical protein